MLHYRYRSGPEKVCEGDSFVPLEFKSRVLVGNDEHGSAHTPLAYWRDEALVKLQ